MKPSSLLLVLSELALAGVLCGPMRAQENRHDDTAEKSLVSSRESSRIDEYIARLGSSKFSVREEASADLLALGDLALESLKAVGPSEPFEVRHRAALVRERIENAKFARLSRSFLLDLNSSNSYGLPAWHSFQELVGSTRTSKLLFLEMIRRQPELARLIEEVSGKTPSAALSKLELLSSREATQLREEDFAMREPHLGDAVAMLMVAASLPHQTPVEISEVIVSNERRSFDGHITQQGYGDCLRRLMSAWLPKTHQSMAPTAMDCALRYDLSEGLAIARRHLTPNFDSDTRKLAFYCLARYGNETDLPLLQPLLSDQQVVDEFARIAIEGDIHVSNAAPPGVPRELSLSNNMVVRINDLAIATSMLLLAEDPTELYPRFETHAQLGFFIHSLAAPPEAAEQQQRRIDQWIIEHPSRQIES